MHFLTERILAAALAVLSGLYWTAALAISNHSNPESPLQSFYVEGLSHTLTEASILLFVSAICFGIYTFSGSIRNIIHRISFHISEYLQSISMARYALISFSTAALFLFLFNAPGILLGTFMIDDYKMYAIATESTIWELLWIPINDHVIPLFWLELKLIFTLIGANPPVLNLPLFAPAVIAIGGASILFRMLGFGPSTLFLITGIFASTTVVSHQLYGFYAVAPYFQVLAIFILSLITLLKAFRSARFVRTYKSVSLVLLAMALLMESGGIWTPIAYILFVYVIHVIESGSWSIRSVLRNHIGVLISAVSITLAYLAYLIVLPHFTSISFFGFNRLPISFDTLIESYHVLTAGVFLSLIAPRLGLIISQPTLSALIVPWHISMFVLFLLFLALIVYVLYKSTPRARILVPYFTIIMLGTALLVAIARPSSNPAAFYRDQNLLFPLFFLALALSVFAHEWIQSAVHEAQKRTRIAITVVLIIMVLVSQQVFSFYKIQYLDDIAYNKSLVAQMRETLTPALNELSSPKSDFLAVPSISALFLKTGNHQLPELSDFSSFIGVQNVTWLPVNQGPYRASTSPEFIESLKHDERLQKWYLADGELYEICASESSGENAVSIYAILAPRSTSLINAKEPVLLASSVDPAREHILYFDIEAHSAPEKIFIDLSFNNDFGANGTRAHIRLDQYTKMANTPDRRYVCALELNEIPAFALSATVSDFTFTVMSPGNYTLKDVQFESR